MVDVGAKAVTARAATARAWVEVPPATAEALEASQWSGPKGPVLTTAVVAGIQAAKRTWDLIPLCHPLPLDAVSVTCEPRAGGRVEVVCTVRTTHKTGCEMEALTGASVAALTLYDMVKALGPGTVIRSVELVAKTGGKVDLGPA